MRSALFLLVAACSRVAEPDAVIDASTTPADSSSSKDTGADAVDTGVPAACGVTLEGAKWSPPCEAWAEAHCCDGLQACAKDNVCISWVHCIDACANSSDPNCQKKCGPIRIGFQSAYNCIFDIADGAARPPVGCSWP